MDIRDQYDRIVAGDTSDTDIRWSRRQLQLQAFREAAEGDRDARLGALKVAAFLGTQHGLPITATLVADRERDVRTAAFHQAVAARDDGRPLLRDVLAGGDTDLAVAAAELLAEANDRPALNIATRLARAEDPRLRTVAASIIGRVGGMSSLGRLPIESETDPTARAAMELAARRIRGDAERPPARMWWEEGAPPAEVPAPQAPPTEAPTETTPAAPELPAPVSLPVPIATEDEPESAPSASGAAALPSPLPDQPRALCRLLALVAPDDRSPVIAALEAVEPADLGSVWIDWPPGGDPALGRGLAMAATALGRTAFLSKASRMATDPRPALRAEAYRAMGALGGGSTLVPLQRALTDDAPEVRAAVAGALAHLAQRTGRDALVRGWLQAHTDDDEAVGIAIADALEALA